MKVAAESVNMPYMVNRWIGGTLTNFDEISKRVKRLLDIREQGKKGELKEKYTKKEQGLIAKEEEDLARYFDGIVGMEAMPGAVLIIDSDKEEIAVREATRKGIPVVALSSSDCNIREVDYPIVGNDSATASIKYVLDEMVRYIREGVKGLAAKKEIEKTNESPVAPKGIGGKLIGRANNG